MFNSNNNFHSKNTKTNLSRERGTNISYVYGKHEKLKIKVKKTRLFDMVSRSRRTKNNDFSVCTMHRKNTN